MILSLQGCMAVGKTTAVNYLQQHSPYVNISREDTADIINQVKSRKLNKNICKDYLEIQKIWINQEIQRYEKAKNFGCSIMDFGAEEIEFYTINYPKTIGEKWDIEKLLHYELKLLRACMPDRILFLYADEFSLNNRKNLDGTRSREFFDYYLKNFMPLKQKWFSQKDNVDFLDTSNLSASQVGNKVKTWVDNLIKK